MGDTHRKVRDADLSHAARSDPKVFIMLENHPEVMTDLAHRLGLSEKLSFHDVYSLYDPDLLALMPRPVYALLVTIPLSDTWKAERLAEDGKSGWYSGSGPEEATFWIRQTIVHGCGLIGLLHCMTNGLPPEMITSGSLLAQFRDAATPLKMDERAQLLAESEALYQASQAAAVKGDTQPYDDGPAGNHFVAFVIGRDRHLWELEGSRKGPLDRGALGEGDDALSEKSLDAGIRRVIELQRQGGNDMRFSCIALGPSLI